MKFKRRGKKIFKKKSRRPGKMRMTKRVTGIEKYTTRLNFEFIMSNVATQNYFGYAIKMYDPGNCAYNLFQNAPSVGTQDRYSTNLYAGEWLQLINLFDCYKINGFSIKIQPYNTVEGGYDALAGQAATFTLRNTMCHTWWDPDNTIDNPNYNSNNITNTFERYGHGVYKSYQIVRSQGPIKRYMKPPKMLQQGSSLITLNATNYTGARIFKGGYMNSQSPPTNGIMYVYANDIFGTTASISAVNLGQIKVSYYVTFKYRY